MTKPMQPTYYVKHPDDSYSVANPQPVLLGADVPRALCGGCHGFGCAPCNHTGIEPDGKTACRHPDCDCYSPQGPGECRRAAGVPPSEGGHSNG